MTAASATMARAGVTRRWSTPLRYGAIGAAVAVYLCLVGIATSFNQRALVAGVLSLGQAMLVMTFLAAGYFTAQREARGGRDSIVAGGLAGGLSGAALSVLVVLGAVLPLRAVLIEASDELYQLLTFGLGVAGFWLPALVGAALGAIGGATHATRPDLRRSLIVGLLALLLLGVFGGLIRTPLLNSPMAGIGSLLFSSSGGLTVVGAIVTLAGAVANDLGARLGARRGARAGGRWGAVVGTVLGGIILGYVGTAIGGSLTGALIFGGIGALIGSVVGMLLGVVVGALAERRLAGAEVGRRVAALPEARQRAVNTGARVAVLLLLLLLILWLPISVGPFFATVVVLVALYVLMGLGLNITLGLAGLLDLGFVAFFAVGAYTVGLLTSTAEFGLAQWPFWAAVPVAVLLAMAFGAILGLPILGIRGDYLAIATLGFGEIIRILAGSNLMLPLLGGPRGIVNIPKPLEVPPTHILAGPIQIYYIAIIAAALVAFVAWRLRDSRLGRAWLAIREDEDVAEALGINLVQTKLLAYMLGAAFAGLGGAVFAAHIGAAFPSDINLFVSINVAALIIVGGMGSIPGVVVGAIFLIGLPELFREFVDYRYLFYGVALIMVMRFRPEGLLPSRAVQRELHVAENVEASGAVAGAAVAQREAE